MTYILIGLILAVLWLAYEVSAGLRNIALMLQNLGGVQSQIRDQEEPKRKREKY